MKLLFLTWILAFSTIEQVSGNVDNKSPVVSLDKLGKLQGIRYTSRKGREYFGFLGIPFGKIPQRFAAPEPAEPWTGIKAVDQLPPTCFQFNVLAQSNMGVEDCLQLNVYTPKLQKNAKLPVLVWIFPGGFQIAGASLFEAKYLMDEDAILVTINYRVGALGFLDTTDGEVSGNMGLKDQVLGLKWVQQNIEQFGGDPKLVTAIGNSAGAASVNYHLISPMSKGLIQRGIAQSGSSLNPWAFQHNPKLTYERFARNAGCLKDTTAETVSCLREKPQEEIAKAQWALARYPAEYDFLLMKFVPTIESPKSKSPRFLEEHPYSLMEKGQLSNKVPYLTGFTENEGAFFTAIASVTPTAYPRFNKEWNQIAPTFAYYDDIRVKDPSTLDDVSQSIRKFYYGTEEVTPQNQAKATDILSDRFFINGVLDSAALLSKHQPVYTYVNNYKGKHSGIQFVFPGVKDKKGMTHADELLYMFNRTFGYPETELKTDDGDFSEKYIKLLVSFAKDGKPSATWGQQKEWSPLKAGSNIQLYDIDLKKTRLLDNKYEKSVAFWNSLPLIENKKFESFVESTSKDEL